MKTIMALTWFLVFIAVKIFGESTCTSSVKPAVCEDLSLQCVFFLVPPNTELENLMKFLGNIESATIFEIPENDGMVRVICDPKDWEEIYRYTQEHGINFRESTYCIGKSELSALKELRLRKNKLRGLTINEALDNILDIDTGNFESNDGVSRVLKNVGKNRSMTTTRKDEIRAQRSSTTSISSRKSESRRSVDTESAEGSSIGNIFRRIKRYSWDILTKNDNYAAGNGRGEGDVILNLRETRSRTIPSGEKGTSPMSYRKEDADDGESAVPSSGESDITESAGTMADINTTDEVISETTTDRTGKSVEEITPAGGDKFRIKKSRRDSDHSKIDDFHYATIAPSSYAELADHIYHVFEWVKDLERRSETG